MRFTLMVLAVAGILVSSLALSRHLSDFDEPAVRGSYWNSSAVNHSEYSVVDGIPVALIGIVGYTLLGVLAFLGRFALAAVCSLLGLGYALYLTNIEAHILELWCVYCVASLVVITITAFVAIGGMLAHREPLST